MLSEQRCSDSKLSGCVEDYFYLGREFELKRSQDFLDGDCG